MSIGSLSGSTSNVTLASLMSLGSASSATSASLRTDAPPPPPPRGGGGLLGALKDLLGSLGIDIDDTSISAVSSAAASSASTVASSASASSATSTVTTNTTDAKLDSFLQQLMAALHAQGGAAPANEASDEDADSSSAVGINSLTASAYAPSGLPPPRGGLGGDLDSLIASLSGSDDSDTDDSDSTLDSLKSSFAKLTGGDASSSTSLSSFLDALKSKLADGRPSGNLIDTTA